MADNFGLKIGLEGEKEFKKALADINQSFKVLGSEMKVVQSQFDKNDDSVEALTARNQVLGKEIDAQKKKIETLRKALENASTSFGENDRRTQQWQIQLNNAQAALNNMERELDQNQRAIDSIPQIIQAGIDLLVSLIQALPQIITTIVAAIPQIITGIVNALINSIPQIIQAGVELLVSLIANLPTIIVEIMKAVPQIITGIVSALGQGVSQIAEVGANLVRGLWQGIQSLAGWIWDKVSGWISGIWDGILGFFGINSPSKEMAWVGEMLVEGLAGSIEDNGGQAVKAAEGMSKDINGVMQDLAKDMTTALPTDFSVKGSVENAMTSAVSGGSGKSGFVLQLNIGTFNNYTNEDIRQLTNEIMVTAGQFAKRKGVVFA